jgi:Lrp/AsnC family transcriptional regulator for asnA, asnC and gidA
MEGLNMLDEIDLKLIRELQQDGRQSHVVLAQKLNVGETTVRRRLQRLLENGSIRVVAVPHPFRLGLNFVCTMRFEIKKDMLRQFARGLVEYPNVYYLGIITGEWDVIAVLVLHSPDQLSDFMWRVAPRPEVIRSETVIDIEVLKSPWEANLDLASLLRS